MTQPPDWWIADRLALKQNQQLLEQILKGYDLAMHYRDWNLSEAVTQLYWLYSQREERRLNELTNQMECCGVTQIPAEWIEDIEVLGEDDR